MSSSGCVYRLAVCLCVFGTLYTLACGSQVNGLNQCLDTLPSCYLCGDPINVTIRAKNILVNSTFEIEAVVLNVRRQPLQAFLEQAGSVNDALNRFKSTYYKGLGYFIDTINGITGSVASKTFWHISSGGVALRCGVSSYIPLNNEVILFNFTTYRDAGYE